MADEPMAQFGESWAPVLAALGNLPVALIITNMTSGVVWANQEYLAVSGRSADEVCGPVEQHIRLNEELSSLPGSTQSRWSGDVTLCTGGLGEVRRHLTVAPLAGPDGLHYLLWTLQNPLCTEEDGGEVRYRSLFQNMSEGVSYCRMIYEDGQPVDFIHLAVNNAFEPLTGLKNVLGRRICEVIPGLRDANREMLETYGRVARTGNPEKFETFVAPMGMWFSVSVYSPKPDHFVTIFENISQRKRAEREMNSLATAIEQAGEQVVITDQDGTIRYCNPAFERVTGYSKEDVVGLNPKVLKSGRHPPEFYDRLWSTILSGRMWSGQLTNRRKDGTIYHEESTISPIRDGGGQIVGFVAVKRDATERMHLENQLRQAQKLESVGRLAGGVAHDFNNLLTVINGFAAFILKALPTGDPVRGHAQQIINAGERAASLTRQLLAFSRKSVNQPRPMDLNGIVRESELMFRRLIGEDVELITNLDPFLGQTLADPDQIHQVLMNLVVNARDAMPNGGKLIIETSNVILDDLYVAGHPEAKPGPCVLLSVSDTGHGMDEATRSNIFEPFFTTKEPGKGTGLGLSTVYGIVRQSQGWIWVYSEPEQGATFKVYLPRIDAAVGPAQVPNAAEGGLTGKETILVVEDQDDVRALTCAVLREYGYEVLEARDGQSAMGLAQSHPGVIHLLLTDVILPGMNGRQLTDRMRLVRPDIRVLFTSGYTADVIAHRGVLEQGVAFIPKPFAPDGLAARVREILAEPSTARSAS